MSATDRIIFGTIHGIWIKQIIRKGKDCEYSSEHVISRDNCYSTTRERRNLYRGTLDVIGLGPGQDDVQISFENLRGFVRENVNTFLCICILYSKLVNTFLYSIYNITSQITKTWWYPKDLEQLSSFIFNRSRSGFKLASRHCNNKDCLNLINGPL